MGVIVMGPPRFELGSPAFRCLTIPVPVVRKYPYIMQILILIIISWMIWKLLSMAGRMDHATLRPLPYFYMGYEHSPATVFIDSQII